MNDLERKAAIKMLKFFTFKVFTTFFIRDLSRRMQNR